MADDEALPVRQPAATAPGHLARRLASSRDEQFVGRTAEQDLWRQALEAQEPAFSVLWVHGPGGIGKTTLLRRLRSIAEQSGRLCRSLDAAELVPGEPPAALLAGVLAREGRTFTPEDATPDALGGSLGDWRGGALFIDAAEPQRSWLQEQFLPALPVRCLVVIASRHAPHDSWRSDPGWSRLLRTLPLRNLAAAEARELLRRRGVPSSAHERLCAATYGHPLALALVADLVLQARDPELPEPESSPDVLRVLLERFVSEVPDLRRREALFLAAHARVINETTLRDVMGGSDASELYDWLSGLSFAEGVADGLVLHELARHVLDRSHRQRDPQRYEALHLRLRRRAFEQLGQSDARDRLRRALDCAWLHRFSPVMAPLVAWDSALRIWAARISRADELWMLDAARRFHGDAAAAALGFWIRTRPEAFTALRISPQRNAGFLCALLLDGSQEELASRHDPFARAAFAHARASAPLRPGESLLLYWLLDSEGDIQAPSRVVLHYCADYISRWYCTPRLALSYHFLPARLAQLPSADPAARARGASVLEDWLRLFEVHLHQRAELQIEDGASPTAWRDWRRDRPQQYAEHIGFVELHGDGPQPVPVENALLALAEQDFREHVRRALRDCRSLTALRQSPLCRTRLVALAPALESGEEDASLAPALRLRHCLRCASESLRENADRAAFSCIEHTYLEPAPTQDIAAELVGLPFSTYRRRLAAALTQVCDWLWEREIGGWP